MSLLRCYVRGLGWRSFTTLENTKRSPFDIVTIGDIQEYMSDEAADKIVFECLSLGDILRHIYNGEIISWNKSQKEKWNENGILEFRRPNLHIVPYEALRNDLVLEGYRKIGKCGLFCSDGSGRKLSHLIKIEDGKTILLSEMVSKISSMLPKADTVHFFWTACAAANLWPGTAKKIILNPRNHYPYFRPRFRASWSKK